MAQLFLAASLAVDERPDGSWHSEWAALRSLLRLTGGACAKLAELATGLQVHPGALAANAALTGDLLLSERITSRLAPLVDGGKATVQELVTRSLTEGLALRPLLRAAVPASALPDADFESSSTRPATSAKPGRSSRGSWPTMQPGRPPPADQTAPPDHHRAPPRNQAEGPMTEPMLRGLALNQIAGAPTGSTAKPALLLGPSLGTGAKALWGPIAPCWPGTSTSSPGICRATAAPRLHR